MRCGKCAKTLGMDCFDQKNDGTTKKSCRICLERARKFNMKPEQVAKRKKYYHRPEVKERVRLQHDTDEYRQRSYEYRHSDDGKEQTKRQNAKESAKQNKRRYADSEKGAQTAQRKIQKRRDDPEMKLKNAIGTKMRKMLAGERTSSVTVSKYSDLGTGKLLCEHLQSLFEANMSFDNYGYGPDKWNIGHRIARAMFTDSTEDMRRCWSSANLFPQWQSENFALKVRLPGDRELLKLQSIWPTRWTHLPTSQERVVYERECSRWA